MSDAVYKVRQGVGHVSCFFLSKKAWKKGRERENIWLDSSNRDMWQRTVNDWSDFAPRGAAKPFEFQQLPPQGEDF